jgi:hypothetical protein
VGVRRPPALHQAALLSVLDDVYKARTPHMNNTSKPQGSPAPIPPKGAASTRHQATDTCTFTGQHTPLHCTQRIRQDARHPLQAVKCTWHSVRFTVDTCCTAEPNARHLSHAMQRLATRGTWAVAAPAPLCLMFSGTASRPY